MIVIPKTMSTIICLMVLLTQAGVDGVLRDLARGRLPLDDVRLETQCLDEGRFLHATAYGSGVAIWNDERQSVLTREQVLALVTAFDREGFARMPASFGGDERDGARMAVKMTCRVRFSGNGTSKDVIQLDKGEQSAALKRLARGILDTTRAATRDAAPIASLDEGLAAVAAGGLAVETLRIRMRVGAGNSPGWLLRIDGRDLEIEPDAGSKTTRRLEEGMVRDLARVFVESTFSTLPVNVDAAEYIDVSVAVLGKEHAVQARRFAASSAPDRGIRERFDRAISRLRELHQPLSGQEPRREIANVAAFARLYGAVRYFYPSDAAASLDWDRFAVHGVKQARAARDARALEATLKALFGPLGPGIVIGDSLPPGQNDGPAEASLVAWRYLGPAVAPPMGSSPYKAQRTNRRAAASSSIDGFVSLMQSIPAVALRGKTIRLRGRVRAKVAGAEGRAALWLRVDRPEQKRGFFDNMDDRPVRQGDWREYSIEGLVADDATNVAFGTLASGLVTADFDAIALEERNTGGGWVEIPIQDPGFEASNSRGWMRVGSSENAQVTRVSLQAPEGRQFLRFAPGTASPLNASVVDVVPVRGAHADIELDSGLKARVPLSLSDAEAAGRESDTSELERLRSTIAAIASEPASDTDTRLADVVVAWNVFRHFYPYWTEAGVDWDRRLRPHLELAYEANTREMHRDALRQLVADARDGHGNVSDVSFTGTRALLPIRLSIVGDDLVVTASRVPAEMPVGAVVTAIDDVPSTRRVAQVMSLISGTTQWQRARAALVLVTCDREPVISLTRNTGTGPQSVSLRCDATQALVEERPAPVTELTSGVWYVDLTRARTAEVMPLLPKLAAAAGVVFDVRGYPTDAGAAILPHLIDAPETDRWMHVPKIIGPFGQLAGWQSIGWNLEPVTPRIAGKVVFLTDGRAISYAESVMGYVADRKLGTIVGSATAGANGNVAGFRVPGGFTIAFTGLRVTRHDGQAPHHLAGITPDISVSPTLAGIRAGRDEVLERAIALVSGK